MPNWFETLVTGVNQIITPVLLIAVIYIADTVTRRSAEGTEHRLSVRAGYWAGFVLFILFANSITSVGNIKIDPTFSSMAPYWVLPTALVIGYYIVYIIKGVMPTRFGGFAIMLMVFLGATSLITYVALDNNQFKQILSWTTLGLSFGILVHAIVNPKSIKDFYPHSEQNPFRSMLAADQESPGDDAGENKKDTD